MLKQVLLLAVVAVVVSAHGHGHEHDDHTHIHTHSHSHGGHDDHGHSHDDHGHSHEDHTDPPVPEMDTDNKWRRVAYNWDELLQKIEKAQAEHTDCGKNCYKSVIANELAPWKDGITPAQFDAAKERVKTLYQIIDGKLYRKGECMFYLRCEGIEHFILGVLGDAKGRQSLSKDKKYPVLPDMEFVLNERDYPHSAVNDPRKPPIFSFSKSPRERDIMYPAWTFWQAGPAISVEPQGMGRWDLKYELMIKAGAKTPWRKKKNVAFFRGSRTSAERDTLVLMSREYPEIVEAAYTKNQAWKSDADTLGAPPASELKLEDHCQYKYLYNFRGVAASFRFKHLFLCGSLVFHVGDEWLEFFYPEMKPWVHYIPIREDLGDAWDLMLFARQNEDVVKSIADAGKKFIQKHLTQDDIYDYWYNLLSEYGKLITWPVALDPKASQVKHK